MTKPFIIDVHGHIGATKGFRARFHSPAEMVGVMDSMSVEILMFVSMGLLSQQFQLGYDEAMEALDDFPDRFRAYTVFDPGWPDVSMRLIEKYQDRPGFVGIKIHPAIHAVPPEDPRYTGLWDYANSRGLVVLTHSWSPDPANPNQDLSTPDRFAAVLESRPNLRLILGHCGGRVVGIQRAAELMRRFPNCWADISGDTLSLGQLEWTVEEAISGDTLSLGQLEWTVEEAGADRLLFGTDCNWIEPRYHLGRLLKANLSAETKMRIMRTNAENVFGDVLKSPVGAGAR
jgi:uncharacterized protein